MADLDHITAGLGRNAMSAAGRFLDRLLGLIDGVQIGDVMLGSAPGGRFQPSPGAGERGPVLTAFMEICSSVPGQVDGIVVELEVAPDVDAPALARASGDLGATTDPTRIG